MKRSDTQEIFLGFFNDYERQEKLISLSKGRYSVANNQFQQGFLIGLNKKVSIITATSIGSFPHKCKRLFFRYDMIDTAYGSVKYLPFINFYFIKEFIFSHYLYAILKKMIDKQKPSVIYVYSLYLPFLKTIKRLKKIRNNLKCVLIIADLPYQYSFLANQKSLAAFREKYESNRKFEYSAYADHYIFLTKQMKDLFTERPYTVIEGYLPEPTFDYSLKRIPKTILYTGSLNKQFGIMNLVDAFSQIEDKDYQLWICGSNGEQNKILEAAKHDTRIKYFGFLSKEKINELQTTCDLLVNPRQGDAKYTKYSFPSKTMEYLLSGSKVVMYRLDGVPDEYYKYIYTIEGNGIEELKDALINACNDKTHYENGKDEQQIRWIKEFKNTDKQTGKFLDSFFEKE